MPQRPDVPCADCGTLMWRGTGSLPAGEARCLPCRRSRRRPTAMSSQIKTCADCGGPAWGARCRPCRNLVVSAAADPEAARQRKRDHARRERRDAAAPGLTAQQRRHLRDKWRRQHRTCSYCDQPGTQLDHVVPLALGGTNHEGNLAPCCPGCNRRKSDSLLIEWKWKVRVRRQHVEPPPRKPREKRWPRTSVYFVECEGCDTLFTSARRVRFCTKACGDRAYNRKHRPAAQPHGTQRQCADCTTPVTAPRRKCDECMEVTRRARKRRQRQLWKRTPAGIESRRRHERRRSGRTAGRGRGSDTTTLAA